MLQWKPESDGEANEDDGEIEIDLADSSDEDVAPAAKKPVLQAPSAKAPAKASGKSAKANRPQMVITPHSPKCDALRRCHLRHHAHSGCVTNKAFRECWPWPMSDAFACHHQAANRLDVKSASRFASGSGVCRPAKPSGASANATPAKPSGGRMMPGSMSKAAAKVEPEAEEDSEATKPAKKPAPKRAPAKRSTPRVCSASLLQL